MSVSKSKEILEMDVGQREALLRRAEQAGVEPDDLRKIRAVFESYAYMAELIDHKNTTLARLRKLLFGARTERTADVLGRPDAPAAAQDATPSGAESAEQRRMRRTSADENPPAKRPGHGRRGADAYLGAKRVAVRHESLEAGDACPACRRGTVYRLSNPGVLVRFVGQAPLAVTVYELEKLRCQLCGKVFTAQTPRGAGDQKFDETVASMIGLLKYGRGFPFNRLDRLQQDLEMPLPASTQWDIVHAPVPILTAAYEELVRQGAAGEVLHNDDTTVKILEWMGRRAKQQALADSVPGQERDAARTGLFTSGVVSIREDRRIALFFSGRRHAGENLQQVLKQRAAELPSPIQMCDALSRNLPGPLETIVANCLAHGRRQFVELSERFPKECRRVLEALETIYRNDAQTEKDKLSPEDRLKFHQAHSGPVMEQLHGWLHHQLDEKLVEPNSGLGTAIAYLTRHWEKLTLFLRKAGAPLDNNICERALKKAILHRKNALFYKTENGAKVGDLYMSLIYTCELNDANPFDYLNALQRHPVAVATAPQNWMPWNYRDNLTLHAA
jgi:transposase